MLSLISATVIEPNGFTANIDDLKALESEFGRAVPLLAELVATNRSAKMDPTFLHPQRSGLKKLPDELLLPIIKQAFYSLSSMPVNMSFMVESRLIRFTHLTNGQIVSLH